LKYAHLAFLGMLDKVNTGLLTVFGLPEVHNGISPQSNDNFTSSALAKLKKPNELKIIKSFFYNLYPLIS
jgi:hypothetical protein